MSRDIQHAKEPWEACGAEVIDGNGDLVVESYHGVNHDQDEANAQFIAAAPEMVEALEQAGFNIAAGDPGPEGQRILELIETVLRKAGVRE